MDGPSVVMPAAAPPKLPQPKNDAAATAREFEGVFLGQMVKIMMETPQSESGFNGGHGEEMFKGILAEEVGKDIARRGGIGLAPAVLNQIILMQGKTPDAR